MAEVTLSEDMQKYITAQVTSGNGAVYDPKDIAKATIKYAEALAKLNLAKQGLDANSSDPKIQFRIGVQVGLATKDAIEEANREINCHSTDKKVGWEKNVVKSLETSTDYTNKNVTQAAIESMGPAKIAVKAAENVAEAVKGLINSGLQFSEASEIKNIPNIPKNPSNLPGR